MQVIRFQIWRETFFWVPCVNSWKPTGSNFPWSCYWITIPFHLLEASYDPLNDLTFSSSLQNPFHTSQHKIIVKNNSSSAAPKINLPPSLQDYHGALQTFPQEVRSGIQISQQSVNRAIYGTYFLYVCFKMSKKSRVCDSSLTLTLFCICSICSFVFGNGITIMLD